jgi:hypothetical protein
MLRHLTVLLAALVLALVLAPTAFAAGPANDRISNPVVIDAIPASVRVDTTHATSSHSDPGYCFGPEMGPDPATVWFSYTATTTGPLGATTFGSDYPTTLYIGTPTRNGFDQLICGETSRSLQSAVRFEATAGVTYLFAVGAGSSSDGRGGNLVFNLDVGPPTQVVDVTLDPHGTIERQNVIFHGTTSCTAPTTFQSVVIVELDQGTGPRAADYIGFADVTSCPASGTPFQIVLEQQVGQVKPGAVTLDIIFAACNDFECGNKTIDLLAATLTR